MSDGHPQAAAVAFFPPEHLLQCERPLPSPRQADRPRELSRSTPALTRSWRPAADAWCQRCNYDPAAPRPGASGERTRYAGTCVDHPAVHSKKATCTVREEPHVTGHLYRRRVVLPPRRSNAPGRMLA